ncbi:hypothetical protein [Yinghuangia sp. YIM S09857]|uniref:hypothetical protein n=1 Tax=Yinghuangia sp. YIM S09857 TaxID=3436929 RepID=UPI003F5308F2
MRTGRPALAASPAWRAALAACCAVLALSACGSSDKDAAAPQDHSVKPSDPPLVQGPPPPVGTAPRLADMSGQRLPVEEFLLQPGQSAKIQAVRKALVVRCLKAQGIDFAFPAPTGPASADSGRTQSEMRYVTPPDVAAKFGYHNPDGQVQPSPPPAMPERTEKALFGKDGRGGCFADVDADLAARGMVVQDSELVVGINVDNMARSMQDERMKAAFAAWSACMKAKGHAYATPMDASGDPRWSQAPAASPEEIATAVAHTACMTENNVVGIWFTVESAYEKREIDAHAAELAAYKAAVDNTLRYADSVLAGA